MEVTYKDGYAYVDEYKFRRDPKSGYYLSTRVISSSRKRLHVYMWESRRGKIEKGYQIHHVDEDKDNNEINNLMCMTKKEHVTWHGQNASEELKQKWRDNLDVARVKASEWHGSEEGRAWHKNQASIRFNHDARFDIQCVVCSKDFVAAKSWSKFCNRNCASKYRRDSGIDNEQRNCVICESEFTISKYSVVKNCSRECGVKSMIINRKKNKRS